MKWQIILTQPKLPHGKKAAISTQKMPDVNHVPSIVCAKDEHITPREIANIRHSARAKEVNLVTGFHQTPQIAHLGFLLIPSRRHTGKSERAAAYRQ